MFHYCEGSGGGQAGERVLRFERGRLRPGRVPCSNILGTRATVRLRAELVRFEGGRASVVMAQRPAELRAGPSPPCGYLLDGMGWRGGWGLLGNHAAAADRIELALLVGRERGVADADRDPADLAGEVERHPVVLGDGRAGVFAAVERFVE